MKTYEIHLRTVNDFRSYANMTVRFAVNGRVQIGGYTTGMYDLLDIMAHCPIEELRLILLKYDERVLPELEWYLGETGLLNRAEGRAQEKIAS